MCRSISSHSSQYPLPFFQATFPMCRSISSHPSQYPLPFFQVAFPICRGIHSPSSQYSLPFFQVTLPICRSISFHPSQYPLPLFLAAFPMFRSISSHSSHELPTSVAANCLDHPSLHYSFRSRSSARTFPICRPRFSFCSLSHSPVNLSPTLLPRHVSSFIFFWFLPHLSSISL